MNQGRYDQKDEVGKILHIMQTEIQGNPMYSKGLGYNIKAIRQ